MRATATAKTGSGVVEAIRVVRLARHSVVNARTKAINQLRPSLSVPTRRMEGRWRERLAAGLASAR